MDIKLFHKFMLPIADNWNKEMKKVRVLYIILGVIFFLGGCTVEQHGYEYPDSFITDYYFANVIQVLKCDSIGVVRFKFDGKNVWRGEEFDRLAEYYGDTSYHGINHDAIGLFGALSSCLTSMKVETIDCFDSLHPAGSDVSDLVDCFYISYMEFIRNNYIRSDYEYEEMLSGKVVRYGEMCKEKVSGINCGSTQLVDIKEWNLVFDKKPDAPGSYKFRLIVKTDDKELSTIFAVDF